MAAINPQTLESEARCYRCLNPGSTAQTYRIALLVRTLVALLPTADVSIQGLITYGQCYACYGLSDGDIVEIALLDQISQAV